MNIESYLYAVLALVFVLALLGLLYLVIRRLGIGGALPRTRGERRLRLVEVLPVDAKRRLLLLRRPGTSGASGAGKRSADRIPRRG